MKVLLQAIGVLCIGGAFTSLIVHAQANSFDKASGIYISMFLTGLVQSVVFFAFAVIIAKLDNIMNNFAVAKTEWMKKNLNVDKFRNGDPIPEAKTVEEWKLADENKQPAWCYYENDSKNGENFGKLYNWYAVIDSRGLAPIGWHIPSDEEWTQLSDYLGGKMKAGLKMKSRSGWYNNGNGTNESGFNGKPGGYRDHNGEFNSIGNYGGWWALKEGEDKIAWGCSLSSSNNDLNYGGGVEGFGSSVRCIKDQDV